MNEIRENIQGLIDYCGDIRNNSDSLRSATYSKDYSPNNIKTVVISTEGVLVRLHRPYIGSLNKGCLRLSNRVIYYQFTPLRLFKPDSNGQPELGKSILEMLVKPLVCASVEEIVFLTGVANEVSIQFVDLMRSHDFNIEKLTLGYKKSGNIHDDIKNRFGRLREIAQVNLNFFSLINTYRVNREVIEKSNFLLDSMRSLVITSEKYNEDWYNGINLQLGTYFMDSELKNYFDGIRIKYTKEDKLEKIKEAESKKYSKDIQELDYPIRRYTSLCTLPLKLRAIVGKGEASGVVDNLSYPTLQYNKLYTYEGFPRGIDKVFINQENNIPLKDAIQKNKEAVGSLASIVDLTSTAFINTLYFCYKHSPITCYALFDKIKELLDTNIIPIIVPSRYKPQVSEMKNVMGNLSFTDDGKISPNSIIYACWLYCICFVDRNSNTSKFMEKSTWQDMVAKKGV